MKAAALRITTEELLVLSTSILFNLGLSPKLKKKKKLSRGIENFSPAKSNRRDGQGKSDRQFKTKFITDMKGSMHRGHGQSLRRAPLRDGRMLVCSLAY